jgi:site-specific DNA-methyltransferase (adenine-specific)
MSQPVIIGDATLYCGDCREILPTLGRVDAVVTDPPYGETSLEWDSRVDRWWEVAAYCTADSASLWCFGSFRMFYEGPRFTGWKLAQDLIWEKHNGSNFHADRFRRVHEIAAHFYKGEWSALYKSPVFTMDWTARAVRRKQRPTHMGHIDAGHYTSFDGGPRIMRSVIQAASCHGFAEHPTQKPLEIVEPLVSYSVGPDATAADPFMGSGTTGVACARLGRKFIGIEIVSRSSST